MKRHEFISEFVKTRKEHYRLEVLRGNMRVSEAMMGCGSSVKEAAALWRKHRKTLCAMSVEQLLQSPALKS